MSRPAEPAADPPRAGLLPLHRRVAWRLAWLAGAATIGVFLRVRVTGREHIPRHGGALILANHTTALDFIMPAWGAWRPVFGIGAARVFAIPVVGWLLRHLNAAPITPGVKDRGAVLHLVEAYQRGQLITMFPEGTRSWAGRPLPITVGTGRLVKRLGCPVVICRITTGHLLHPRWARWPRWVPWRMHYDPPVSYPAEATVEEINRDIAVRLRIDPDTIEAPWGAFGLRLAEGLPAFLWACPACFAVGALAVADNDRSRIVCRGCRAGWRVDLSTRLISDLPGVPALTVAAAGERIAAHFGRAPDLERFARDGVVLEVPAGRIERRSGDPASAGQVAAGRVRLYADRLECAPADGGVPLTLALADIDVAAVDARNQLSLRVAGASWLLLPGGDSPHLWHYFLANGLVPAQRLPPASPA